MGKQNLEYFGNLIFHIFLSVNAKILFSTSGWRYTELIYTEAPVVRSSMSIEEAKRQRIANLLHARVASKRIADTVGAFVNTVYNVKNRIMDMGGIKRKQGSGSINKCIS